MPPRIFTTQRTPEGEVAIIDAKQAEIIAEAGKYSHASITVENLSGLGPITYAQIKWIKGVLLKQLFLLTGETGDYWESLLKLKVMPDQFAPMTTKTKHGEFEHLDSIKILTKAEAGEFIEGSVAHLRDESKYGTTFHCITLPAKELRS